VLTHLNVDHGTHTLFRVGQSRTISGWTGNSFPTYSEHDSGR
jgi:hypothetical protein